MNGFAPYTSENIMSDGFVLKAIQRQLADDAEISRSP